MRWEPTRLKNCTLWHVKLLKIRSSQYPVLKVPGALRPACRLSGTRRNFIITFDFMSRRILKFLPLLSFFRVTFAPPRKQLDYIKRPETEMQELFSLFFQLHKAQ